MKNALSIMKGATQKAFAKVASVNKQQTDPDLQLYSRLKPENFVSLMKDYGEENVISYIKAMEAKRIMGGQ